MNRVKNFWQERTGRERFAVAAAAVVVLLALFYGYLWQPGTAARARLRAELPQLRAQLAQMRVQSTEVARLRGGAKPAPGSGLKAAVEASAEARGLRQGITLVEDDGKGHVRLALKGPFDAWMSWSQALQMEQRLRVASARIEAVDQPGWVSIQAVLVTPGAP